jgi:hypothetical protein
MNRLHAFRTLAELDPARTEAPVTTVPEDLLWQILSDGSSPPTHENRSRRPEPHAVRHPRRRRALVVVAACLIVIAGALTTVSLQSGHHRSTQHSTRTAAPAH